MTLLKMIFAIIYLISMSLFIYYYYKNNYELKPTLNSLMRLIKKHCIFCTNKENLKKELGEEKAKEVEELVDSVLEAQDSSSCKEPVPGLSLDLCLSDSLSKEEIIIREKVLKILKQKKQTLFDGGKEKLIIPMESILFLTKKYNPLVSEEGDIVITIKKDNSAPDELINELAIKLENGETLYEDDKNLMNSIVKLHNTYVNKKEDNELELKEMINDNSGLEDISKPNEKPKTPEKLKEFIQEEELKQKNEPLKERESEESNLIKDNSQIEEYSYEINETPYDPSGPYDDEDDNEMNNEFEDEFEEDYTIGGVSNLFDGAIQQINELNELNDENERDFYQNLEYKSFKGSLIDMADIENSIDVFFKNTEAFHCFFNNLAKTTPLVFNANKSAIFIDVNNVLFALAKCTGINFVNTIDDFVKLGKDRMKFLKAVEKNLEPYLSDIMNSRKSLAYYYVKDKAEEQGFILNGFSLKTDSFLNAFENDDYDYFRSSPHNGNYVVTRVSTKEDSKNTPPLILDIKDVEIV